MKKLVLSGVLASALVLSFGSVVMANNKTTHTQTATLSAQAISVREAFFAEAMANSDYYSLFTADSAPTTKEEVAQWVLTVSKRLAADSGTAFFEVYLPENPDYNSPTYGTAWVTADMMSDYFTFVAEHHPEDLDEVHQAFFASDASGLRAQLHYDGDKDIFMTSAYYDILESLNNCVVNSSFQYDGTSSPFSDGYVNFDSKSVQSSGSAGNVTPNIPMAEGDTTPEATPESKPVVDTSDKLAEPSTAKVMVNGEIVPFGAYEIEHYNYFKLTDMAFALDGTSKQFQVTWDGEKSAVNMVSGEAHLTLGNEMQGNSGQNETAEYLTTPVYQDGEEIDVLVYTVGGSSYFQLDTLKGILDLNVGWDGDTSTITITTD